MTNHTAAIIEARMSSSRLPGKVLLESCGKPLLQHMVERVSRAQSVKEVIIATSNNAADQKIIDLCKKMNIRYFAGDETNVLKRVLDCAEHFGVETIIELTGDCPLIDPEIIDYCFDFYKPEEHDYLSNCQDMTPPTYEYHSFPIGMAVEIFSTKSLSKVSKEPISDYDKEHVSSYFYTSGKFRIECIVAPQEWNEPEISITLDEEEDYRLINLIFENLYKTTPQFSLVDILKFLERNPEHKKINAAVTRKSHLKEVGK